MKPIFLTPAHRSPKSNKPCYTSLWRSSLLTLLALVLVSSYSAQAATLTWSGGGDGIDWSTSNGSQSRNNWGGTQFTTGDNVIFGGTTRLGPSIGGSALTAGSITFNNTSGAFMIGGTATLTINGGVVNNDDSLQSFSVTTITLGASQTWNAGAVAGGGLAFTGTTLNLGALTLTVDGTNNTSIANLITGTAGVTKIGSGVLTLSNANTYSGVTSVSGGTLSVSGSINNSTTINITGGILSTTGANKLADTAAVTISGGTLTVGGADTIATLTMSSGSIGGSNTLTATSYNLSGGTVTGNLGAGTMNVTTGTVTLNGTAAATTVNINSGTLAIGANDRLANGAAVAVAGGTLNIASFNDTVGAVSLSSGNINGTGGALTGSSYSLTDTGTVSAILAGAGTLTKTGSGAATLSGANTYTGITSINAGTLVINGNQSAATGAVNVASIAKLFGNGTIGGATTILGTQSSGSSAGAVGTQTFSNSLTYSSGSIFEWDINVTGANAETHDKVVASSLLGSGAVFKVGLVGSGDTFASAFWDTTRNWSATDLFGASNANANLASIFSGANTTFNSNTTQGSFSFTSISGGTNNNLKWTAVPEPTSALAGILLGAGLLRRKRTPNQLA